MGISELKKMIDSFSESISTKPVMPELTAPKKNIYPSLSEGEIGSILTSDLSPEDVAPPETGRLSGLQNLFDSMKNPESKDRAIDLATKYSSSLDPVSMGIKAAAGPVGGIANLYDFFSKAFKTSDESVPTNLFGTETTDEGDVRVLSKDLNRISAGRKSVIADDERNYEDQYSQYKTDKKLAEEEYKNKLKNPDISYSNLDENKKKEFLNVANTIFHSSLSDSGYLGASGKQNDQLAKTLFKERMGKLYPVWEKLKQELIYEKEADEAIKKGASKDAVYQRLEQLKQKLRGE